MATSATPSTTQDESDTTETTDACTRGTSEPTTPPEGSTSLPSDQLFGLLSVSRRRDVLRYLDGNSGEDKATLSVLAEHIAAKENDVPVSQLSSQQRKRVYISLYQCHLPKLDDANVIEYDQARGTIELRAAADRLLPHLYLKSTDVNADTSPNIHGDSPWPQLLPTSLVNWVAELTRHRD